MIDPRDRAALALFDAAGRAPELALTEDGFLALLAAVEMQISRAIGETLEGKPS